jgi:mannose-6-phosphate isomerase-like protein (cupin superfamily)
MTDDDDAQRRAESGTGAGTRDAPPDEAFDLSTTHIHLGLGARATPLPDFEWSPEYLDSYTERFAADGDDGRLVAMGRSAESWTTWERHPAGEEVVVLLSGRVDLIQRIDGAERRIPLRPGQAVINPPGVWHTADVHEPGDALFITPGRGTENEPR